MEPGQPCTTMSACLNNFAKIVRATSCPRSFLNQPCARTGLPFLLLANQAGPLQHPTMASSGVTPDPLLPDATSVFTMTHWSVVVSAGDVFTEQAPMALERLCQTYWSPRWLSPHHSSWRSRSNKA